jgi:hypothetical protein
MNISSFKLALLTSLLLLALIFNPTIARAQYGVQQCAWILQQLTQAMSDNSAKQIIALERQYLTYCREYMEPAEYAAHLGSLAAGLNGDNQQQEALGVANRCLQINAADLSCLYEKANALSYLGRLQEAKGVIEKSLTLGAITEVDAAVKPRLRELLAQVNAAITQTPERVPAARNGNIAQSLRAARGDSAKVAGSVSCNGTAVGLSIDIDGEIDARTVESVSKLFDEYHERETKVKSEPCDYNQTRYSAYGDHYGINSRGGNVAAAMAIGRMFRKENAWLGVKGVCISACVLILAGAVDRQIGGSDVVGIHRPYFGTTPQRAVTADQVKSAYRAMLQDIRAYLREMNVAERLADDMLAVEPERVRVLTQAELKGYGLAGLDPAEQQRRAIENEARDVREAAQLGLDRAEYARRKALGESVCAYTSAGEPVADYPEFWKCKQRVLKTGQR